MKKLLLILGSWILPGCMLISTWEICYAEQPVAPVPATAPASSIYFQTGPLSLTVPFENVSVVYLYDVVSKQSLVGGETPIAALKNKSGTFGVVATIGAVTSMSGQGNPFIGGNLMLPNPAPNFVWLGQIQPGFFGGYSPNGKHVMAGFKASINIF